MSNILARFLSAAVITPLFLLLVYLNNLFFFLLLSLIFIFVIYELKFLYLKKKSIFFILFFIIVFFIYSLFSLRGNDFASFVYLVWIFFIIWISDIAGYFTGKLIGGKKLSKWSPNKTISGFIGSLFFSQFSFIVILKYQENIVYSFKFFIIQILISLASVSGDLFFSFIKRKNNIKDYSNLIPGHGGVLDRIDGMIFAVIFSFLLNYFHVI